MHLAKDVSQEGECFTYFEHLSLNLSRVQMKSWAGKALDMETVNCCAFLKHRLIGAC
jgi:hypothetical protein